ncbi:hypothetical protein BWI97_14210 [Siphonobacter sp. BAB-5405]|uniref:hypothetical protein n=1 Tax=Siphonobacter sp. BAB-5405 TaxID=1864825 RepID=UPI000C80F760|nr:hypothetical protein [Siphonobacter sp. BAB-5405]PMD95505.1 hypothetical protein BWI97_14210 [Siphonobacter sp. BAB-5405]
MKKYTASELRDMNRSIYYRGSESFGGTKSENAASATENYIVITQRMHELQAIRHFPSEKVKGETQRAIEYARTQLRQLRQQYPNEVVKADARMKMYDIQPDSKAMPAMLPGLTVVKSPKGKKILVSNLVRKRKPIKKNDPVKAVRKTVSASKPTRRPSRQTISVASLIGKKKPIPKNDPVKAVRKSVARTKSGKFANSEFGKILKRADQIHLNSPVVSTRTIRIRKISRSQAKRLALKEAKRK